MSSFPVPENERERMERLRSYAILDSDTERSFDDLTMLAAQLCETPIALITFVDDDRQWFKSRLGLPIVSTPRQFSFCAHAIAQPAPLVVPDARDDARFAENPLVTSQPFIRFYAGVQLRTADGLDMGTLCVIDRVPRELTARQMAALEVLGRQVMSQIELRRSLAERARAEAALRDSHQLLHSVIDNAIDVIFIKDVAGRYLLANRAAAELVGMDPAVMVGRSDRELFPAHADYFEDQDRIVRESGQPMFFERRRPGLAGQPIDLLTAKYPFYAADGSIAGIVGIGRDITSYKQLEQTLRETLSSLELRVAERTAELVEANAQLRRSQAEAQALINAIPDILFRLSRTGRYLEVKAGHRDELYLDPLDFLGRTVADTLPPALAHTTTTAIARALATGEPQIFEYQLALPAGLHDFEARIVVSGSDEVLALIRNITRRKTSERGLTELTARLQHSRNLLMTLFDGLPDGLLLLDRAGEILAANQAFASLLDTPAGQLAGQPWATLVGGDGQAFPTHPIVSTFADGRSRHHRVELTSGTGRRNVLDLHTLPLVDAGGAIDQVILHAIDVTEQQRVVGLALQHERLAASGKLAAILAHEINTPLQSIQHCLYMASRQLDSQGVDYLTLAREEIARIGGILRQLLDTYEVDDLRMAPLDLNAVVERVLLLTGHAASSQGVVVDLGLDPQLPQLHGLADQLVQVVLNLVLNALDAMPAGGQLLVATASLPPLLDLARPAVELVIADNGSGMSAEIQAQIFDPFFTTKERGSGLGLAAAQKIVALHRGTIVVASAPAAGSRFTITLPLDPAGED